MPSKGAEDSVFKAASTGLKRWLGRARDAVMAPFRQFKAQPNPQAIAATVPVWQSQVDRIVAALTLIRREPVERANAEQSNVMELPAREPALDLAA